MDSGLRPVLDSVNAIRVPQDYVTQSGPLREMNGSVGWRNSCKMRSCRPMLRTCVKTE